MERPQQAKKKCRQYSVEYLKYEFIEAKHRKQQPICLLCEKAMKPSEFLEYLTEMHSNKANI